jgi:hypothetical protein
VPAILHHRNSLVGCGRLKPTQTCNSSANTCEQRCEQCVDQGDKHRSADVSADADGFTGKRRATAATPNPSPLGLKAPPPSTSSALFAPPAKSLASPAGGAGSLFGAFGTEATPDRDPASSSFAFPMGKDTVATGIIADASSSKFSFGPAASSDAGAANSNRGGVDMATMPGDLFKNTGGPGGGFGGSTPAFGSGGSTAPLFGGVQSGVPAGGGLFGAGASRSSSIFASAGTASGGTTLRFAALPSEEGALCSLYA